MVVDWLIGEAFGYSCYKDDLLLAGFMAVGFSCCSGDLNVIVNNADLVVNFCCGSP